MSARAAAWALALAACGADPDGGVDGAADTDVPAPDPAGPAYTYVGTSFVVAPAEEAFDLDGDGAPDSAIAALGPALDGLIADRLRSNVHVVLVQLDDVGDWAADAGVRAALFPAVDLDDDGADNGSGVEAFDGEGFVDAAGHARLSAPTALADGAFAAWLDVDAFQVGSIRFGLAAGAHVRGTADATHLRGTVGIAVTRDALREALTAEHVDDALIGVLEAMADLDLDADGAAEAVSMAFTIDAAACALTATAAP